MTRVHAPFGERDQSQDLCIPLDIRPHPVFARLGIELQRLIIALGLHEGIEHGDAGEHVGRHVAGDQVTVHVQCGVRLSELDACWGRGGRGERVRRHRGRGAAAAEVIRPEEGGGMMGDIYVYMYIYIKLIP